MERGLNLDFHSRYTFQRLNASLKERFSAYASAYPQDWGHFMRRFEEHFDALFRKLFPLYGDIYDFYYYLEKLAGSMAQSWVERAAPLKTLDAQREQNSDWFLANEMVGGVCYVDLFGGNLRGVSQKKCYFKELGLTYLHLMPLFRSPEGENDGGYAISSYREVNPALGNMQQLIDLAEELRCEGISLVVDFVFNHTSSEHDWALRARAGDSQYQEYYFMFPDREMPDRYEVHLREIFPDEHPGAFTYFDEIGQWVWTTFHSYQWDLNYQNPAVFVCMAEEMLALANAGVDVLRLDAVAFIWKQMGTPCENLPQAHQLIQVFNLVTRIAAPAMLFKSEAIVHPDEVARYISLQECQLSYNPLLMALLWESLATRQTSLLNLSLQERFELEPGCAWVNYVRCHDDIGWTFSDEDAARLGINAYDHRQFLNVFYTGRFSGSFGRGLPFQENPRTGDCRISGTCASLAGMEKALAEETEVEVELALRRILLIHGIILTVGGIPLFYLGDEIATLNHYDYRLHPSQAQDSRWVHRAIFDWERTSRRKDAGTLEGRLFQQLKRLIDLRKKNLVFGGQHMQVISTGNPHVLGFMRQNEGARALVFANFSEQEQLVSLNCLRLYGVSYPYQDMLSEEIMPNTDLRLDAYALVFLKSL